ncbi:KIAA0195 (predicted) [Pycnogonum litorale]
MAAFSVLEKGIEMELDEYEIRKKNASHTHWFTDAYLHSNRSSLLPWPGILLILLLIIVNVICYEFTDSKFTNSLLVEIIVILVILSFSIYIVGLNSYLTHRETTDVIVNLLNKVKECKLNCRWEPGHYPSLESPFSPAINLQWTYRDGNLVNLPCSLLVEGDLIVIHPGHRAPARCVSLLQPEESATEEFSLDDGQIYAPPIEGDGKEALTVPRAKVPLAPKKFILLETPYLKNVGLALDKSLRRPPTFFEKEQFMIKSRLEGLIIPILLVIVVAVNLFHYIYQDYNYSGWTEMLLRQPFHVVLPLLPLMYPICCLILNTYGMARLTRMFYRMKRNNRIKADLKDVDEFEMSSAHYDSTPQLASVTSTGKLFRQLFFGHPSNDGKFHLCRTSKLLHIFGSMTSLCCVDKKGLLSWPNPTAEKVFFLKNPSNTPDPSSTCSTIQSKSTLSKAQYPNANDESTKPVSYGEYLNPDDDQTLKTRSNKFDQMLYHESKVEVLDLTHNNRYPFSVQFDDPNWKQYMNSLKPLGLNILLNTCNPKSHPHYINFCSYLAREALLNEITIPVINRRCLCELPKQIGFVNHASEVFQFDQQLSFFRHVQEELVRKDKITRSLDVKKLKCPMPNAVSVVVKDIITGTPQLLSQGTSDILLDMCSDYWDGNDLIPLTHIERKKILDFYHRTSLTAYCTAFAYRPITAELGDQFSSVYYELPPDYNRFFHRSVSPSPVRPWDPLTKDGRCKQLHYLSTDSVFVRENIVEVKLDPEISLQQVCNQIFIGMVTMQYQPRSDVVRLIEQLDEACVRFVHFSKENELRSRVFSEKMGLESGWNCHISLLSEKSNLPDKPSVKTLSKLQLPQDLSWKVFRSNSAPSAVHYDVNHIRIDDEVFNKQSVIVEMDPFSPHVSNNGNSCNRDETKSPVSDDTSEVDESSALIEPSEIEFTISYVDDNEEHRLSLNQSQDSESSDQSSTVGYDMSNRANLPKGIENIRPHLKNVDNVPLLVSLFTDCTPETTQQMIEIMQEHGEIVCCIGSSANFRNMSVFLQSDSSIGIQPLYPQICMKKDVMESNVPPVGLSPTKISGMLNSIACSLSYHRESSVSLHQLIMEARHYMISMSTCFQLMLYCCLTVTITQLAGCFIFLPPILTGTQILWVTCLIVPVISLPIIFNPTDPGVMSLATGKSVCTFDRKKILFYLASFLPSSLICLLNFGLSFHHVCNHDVQNSCYFLTGLRNQSSLQESSSLPFTETYELSLLILQEIATFSLSLCFVLTSVSYIDRNKPLWKQKLFVNKIWFFSFIIALFIQLMHTAVHLLIYVDDLNTVFYDVPFYVWIIILLWALLIVPYNEFIKLHEIRVNVRLQKRARLEFGTKLGMNSPF